MSKNKTLAALVTAIHDVAREERARRHFGTPTKYFTFEISNSGHIFVELQECFLEHHPDPDWLEIDGDQEG